MNDWLGLGGRTAVVTGGGGGIGRAIALAFAAAGAKVAVLDLSEEGARKTVAAAEAAGGGALAVVADITDPASVEAARVTTEAAFGTATILVNNAALVRNAPLMELSLPDWAAVLTVNLTGYFICAQVFGRAMAAVGGGAIVHVSSLAGEMPQPTSGAYSVSKAGVNMLSRNLAQEWGAKGIRSNVVAPAMVLTPMSEVIYHDPAVRARREAAVPVGRIGMPQDIADAILFLASDRASYVSGQEILCDGGWTQMLLTTVPRPGFDAVKT